MTAAAVLIVCLGAARPPLVEEAERRDPVTTASEQAPPRAERYEDLVALGVKEGRAGHLPEAEKAFERAIALAPGRPEAHVELGGLQFLQGRYDRSVVELRRAVRIRDDTYTRGLLASSLHLAGRSVEALDEWNRIGEPILDAVEIVGLERVRPGLVRSELAFAEGDLLKRRQLETTELRLRELEVFSHVRLRPVPQGDGKANMEVSLLEKRGLGGPGELVVTSIAYALQKKVRLRYTNIAGEGLSVAASYRWESTQPELWLGMTLPRPAGLPFQLHFEALHGRPQYDLGERLTLRKTGLDLRLRKVIGARTVAEGGWLWSRRTVSPGDGISRTLSAVQLGLDHRLLEEWRHRVDGSLRAWVSPAALGSDIHTHRALARVRYQLFLSPPEAGIVEPSVLVAQATWGHGGDQIPLDEMFVPGAAADSAYPLRGHPQKRDGVLGRSPISRSLGLINVEWRRRLWRPSIVSLGGVAFYDGAWPGHSVQPGEGTYHDAGLGLRVSVFGTLLRIDYGHSLTGDGKSALTIGLGQTF